MDGKRDEPDDTIIERLDAVIAAIKRSNALLADLVLALFYPDDPEESSYSRCESE
ncbi:MAG: hypothetical protein IH840_00115 [Candidatus Heimdallarchaeota archaeon]|nr:hypothetical protein [Candidatus Heimdallarchaeota archaeon]